MIDLNRLPVDITSHIIKFRDFMNASWPFLDDLMEEHDWENEPYFTLDWLQANWELLVERELLGEHGYLTEFSMSMVTSRYRNPDAKAIYAVVVKPVIQLIDLYKNTVIPSDENLIFYSFKSACKGGGFGLYPPFDLVCIGIATKKETTSKNLFLVPLKNLIFYLDHYPTTCT